MDKRYKVIALIGKAGSGKDYTLHKVLAAAPPRFFNEIISTTTRPMREGEQEGVNYYYISDEEFGQKILNGEMLESTEFNGWFYGTELKALEADRVNIGVFNPDGIRALAAAANIDLTVYCIECSDKERLIRQLNREENPNVDEIVRRYKTDQEDFAKLESEFINGELNIDIQHFRNETGYYSDIFIITKILEAEGQKPI